MRPACDAVGEHRTTYSVGISTGETGVIGSPSVLFRHKSTAATQGFGARQRSGHWLVAVLGLVTTSPAFASPLDLYGYGGRSPGLAGAGATLVDDYDASYTNPAGLADASHKRLGGGYLYGRLRLRVDGRNIADSQPRGFAVGAALPIPLRGSWNNRLVLGVGTYAPTTTLTNVNAPRIGQPFFALLQTRSDIVAVLLSLGVKLNDQWRIGAGVHALGGLRGRILVTTDGAENFVTEAEERLTTHYAPIVGARYHGDRMRLALVVHTPSRAEYDIKVDTDIGDVVPIGLPGLRFAGVSQYDPLTVVAEASYQWSRPLTVLAHLSYQHWSWYPRPTENPVAGGQPLPDPNFRNVVVPRLAAEWHQRSGVTHMTVRAGYGFAMTPAPHMNGPHTLLDSNRHVVALGLRLAWPGTEYPLYLDGWIQGHRLHRRRHSKNAALFDDPETIPFDSIDTSGNMIVGGFSMAVDL